MLDGTISFFDVCHSAWSSRTIACAPGATARAISAKPGEPLGSTCRFIASMLQRGSTRPAPLPCWGQHRAVRAMRRRWRCDQASVAPEVDVVRWSFGALGRVPRLAQRQVILFFWPILASSANHTSIAARSRPHRAVVARKALRGCTRDLVQQGGEAVLKRSMAPSA